MAHESFEDEATAALMNERFVNVKVDREERPDVDAIYMTATQAMTGQGGWPMTVFATPDGHPFYTGTYFPRAQFQRLLIGISEAWRNDREGVLRQGAHVVRALTEHAGLPKGPLPTPDDLAQAERALAAEFDPMHGGFGTAPKFPPSMVLEFLLRRGTPDAMRIAGRTLAAMAYGGIYDQLGGGFARYSVDATWTVPHFEKMLYDNALLLRVYTHWWRALAARPAEENPDRDVELALARRIALETADWLLAEMRTPEGGFASALDADSEGEEGKFYVWTPDELRAVLGDEDGAWACRVFGVTDEGTFERGTSVLRLLADPLAPRPGSGDPEAPADPDEAARFARVRAALREARAARVRPGRDDKVVAAWNGLTIAALAEAGVIFDRPDLVDAARAAAVLLDEVHVAGGRLLRTSRDGRPGPNAGVLEDYGDVAEGLLTLYGVTGETRWFRRAGELLDVVLEHFPDGKGGFYDTPDDGGAELFQRPQDPTDNAAPSGTTAAAGALLTYAALTGSARHREAAESALGVVSTLAAKFARFAGWGLAVAQAAQAGPVEVAVVGPAGDPRTAELHRAAFLADVPGAAIALGEPADGRAEVPLLEARGLVDGRPAAYVCRRFTCRAPVTTPDELRAELAQGR
ncbi:thioredoxin domain-containing protein [Thermopolyspora flexuosa]|nr:thioredoxin domain-containing protein [Thermopolyspora flexuosa]